jgi:hypothetical protein
MTVQCDLFQLHSLWTSLAWMIFSLEALPLGEPCLHLQVWAGVLFFVGSDFPKGRLHLLELLGPRLLDHLRFVFLFLLLLRLLIQVLQREGTF